MRLLSVPDSRSRSGQITSEELIRVPTAGTTRMGVDGRASPRFAPVMFHRVPRVTRRVAAVPCCSPVRLRSRRTHAYGASQGAVRGSVRPVATWSETGPSAHCGSSRLDE